MLRRHAHTPPRCALHHAISCFCDARRLITRVDVMLADATPYAPLYAAYDAFMIAARKEMPLFYAAYYLMSSRSPPFFFFFFRTTRGCFRAAALCSRRCARYAAQYRQCQRSMAGVKRRVIASARLLFHSVCFTPEPPAAASASRFELRVRRREALRRDFTEARLPPATFAR